jgi:hypothetical protein
MVYVLLRQTGKRFTPRPHSSRKLVDQLAVLAATISIKQPFVFACNGPCMMSCSGGRLLPASMPHQAFAFLWQIQSRALHVCWLNTPCKPCGMHAMQEPRHAVNIKVEVNGVRQPELFSGASISHNR